MKIPKNVNSTNAYSRETNFRECEFQYSQESELYNADNDDDRQWDLGLQNADVNN